MIASSQFVPIFHAIAAFILGAMLGLPFFSLMQRNLVLYFEGHAIRGVVLHAVRILLIVAGLAGAVQFGAVPLLACTLGIVMARHITIHRALKGA